MADSRVQAANPYKPMRAPRGPQLSCKAWPQEAARRLLMNSADPAVAEHPEKLIISGGIGKPARDWQAFHAIAEALQSIEDEETLVIQDGEQGPILKTNPEMPRVLVVNSTPPPADWMFTGPSSALPEAYGALRAAARRHFGGSLAGRLVVAAGMSGGMGGSLAVAATLNGAAFLGIDADVELIKRRVKTGYCEVMVNSLDETLRILKNAVRKGQPASVGLIANAAELVPELARRGVLPDLFTDQTYADEPHVPRGLTPAQALELRERDPRAYVQKALDSIATLGRGMLELQKMGTCLFVFGNEREFAPREAYAEPPVFISDYLAAEEPRGAGPLTIFVLSGDLGDLARIDDLFPSLFPESELQRWIPIARRHPSQGLPARSCWISADDASKLGAVVNDLVAAGAIKAPVVIGRSIRQSPGRSLLGSQPLVQSANSGAAGQALVDSPELRALLNAAHGASWLSVSANAVADKARECSAAFVVIDGSAKTMERIARLFANDCISH